MRVGDYIYCHTTGHMAGGAVFAYAGEQYLVESVSDVSISICSERGSDHSWDTSSEEFNQHFSIEKRKSWAGSRIKFNFV